MFVAVSVRSFGKVTLYFKWTTEVADIDVIMNLYSLTVIVSMYI